MSLFNRAPRVAHAIWVAAMGSLLLATQSASASEAVNVVPPPPSLVVRGTVPTPPAGVADLKFHEMFKLPVGRMGLEPTAKMQSLEGKAVRVVGYVANAEVPVPGMIILTPIPVTLGDDDERLVDDLPPSAVFVHLSPAYAQHGLPNFSGVMQLVGTLQTGTQDEADGHVSGTRLLLDDATSRLLVQHADQLRAQASAQPHAAL